ncbi:MAG: hypothetical protein IIB89_03940 [Chloroflexi bacterium]|nr:hypothetical protein [Chloroflexota bacterium]
MLTPLQCARVLQQQGVAAGRNAYLAGRIGVRKDAIASSPTTDLPQPAPASS